MSESSPSQQPPDTDHGQARDRRNAALLFVYGFGNAAAYVIARTEADSQFLSRIGPDGLPRIYLASAGVVALASAVYGRCVRGASVRLSVVVSLLLLSACSAALPWLLSQFPTSTIVTGLVYLLAQVRGSLGTIQFTMLLNEQFAHRQPERVVGYVGVGATLAGFSVGLALGQLTQLSGLTGLLYVVALIDLLTILPVRLLPPGHRVERDGPDEFFWFTPADGDQPTLAEAKRSAFVMRIAAMVAACVLAATLVEYQWKVAASDHFHRDEQALAGYFGRFYGCIYLITGLMQFFLTGLVLKHRGVLFGLLLFPVALLLASGGVLIAGTATAIIWPLTLAKGCDTLKRSMNDPSIHLLYSPLPATLRHQAITFVAGIVKPLTEAAAASLLILMAPVMSIRMLSIPVAGLIVIWILLNISVWRRFRSPSIQQPET